MEGLMLDILLSKKDKNMHFIWFQVLSFQEELKTYSGMV